MPVFLDDQQELEVDGDDLVDLARYVLRERDVPDDMEVSLLLVDEPTMADLNHVHMGAEGPTDVLAFPIDEPGATPPEEPAILGDVVLCPTVAARQAAERDRSTADELRLLTTHGLLHLLGMDHADGPSEREMFSLTDDLLAGFADREGR
jgi:probable rRNA maturation factor